ncbi:MAG: hypothetical protein IH614_13340 [Desulfuromonadales bacterium]|nr:hypothetical protein [Desulfuromonadales bacterium]
MYEQEIRERWSRNFIFDETAMEQEEVTTPINPHPTENRRLRPPRVDECAGGEFL